MVTKTLQAAVSALGSDQLGFTADEIGTHSLRSGAAMQMYLGEIPVYTIMLIGRWSSDAFLRYIRKQVEQFSHMFHEKCSLFYLLDTSQTSPHAESHQTTPGSKITPTMQKQETILDTTCRGESSYLRSHCTRKMQV